PSVLLTVVRLPPPSSCCFLRFLRPPPSPLFPYTTLFRSSAGVTHASSVTAFDFLRTLLRPVAGFSAASSVLLWISRPCGLQRTPDRKSTRLNSSHVKISYAVFCLKKKKLRIAQHNFNLLH